MRSAKLPLVRKHELTDYRKNQARSILFLLLLTLLLLVSVLLSLRAGSYSTPVTELIKGIFGRSADKKINLVIRNNRMPRICTAIVAGFYIAGLLLRVILNKAFKDLETEEEKPSEDESTAGEGEDMPKQTEEEQQEEE